MDWMEQSKFMVYLYYQNLQHSIMPFCEYKPNKDIFGTTYYKRTWEKKGAKYIQVISVEDKKQVTIVVSLIVNGNLFILQMDLQELHNNHYHLPM
jgi:SepF-like predicted cell division protein (DUF552 family)